MKRIKWEYTHHLNSKSQIQIVKEGEYFGKIKHTYRHWNKTGAKQMACVKFDGNKRVSFVPYEELKFVEDKTQVPIIGKVVKDSKFGNRVIFYKK